MQKHLSHKGISASAGDDFMKTIKRYPSFFNDNQIKYII